MEIGSLWTSKNQNFARLVTQDWQYKALSNAKVVSKILRMLDRVTDLMLKRIKRTLAR
jgi:hypothetical protein